MTLGRWLSRALTVVWASMLVTAMVGAFVGPVGTASGQTKQADVVFVFDQTGSMDTQAAALKDEVENVASELQSSGIDARFGLVTYEDRYSTQVRTPLTSDIDALESGLEFSTFGGTENASHGIQVALDRDFRPDAQKIIVVITDEDDDGTDLSRQRTITRLNEEEACLVSVSPEFYAGSVDDELRTMAENADCGRWTDIETESFTSVVTDLTDIIDEVTGPSTGVSTHPHFEVVDTSVATTTPYVGDPVRVTVTVENQGSAAGTYDALLGTPNDILRSEEAEIEDGASHTFTWSLTFDEADKYSLLLNHRLFAELFVEPQPPDPLDSADVEVVDSYVTRSTVWPGETYEVVSVVENTGNRTGQASVAFGTLNASNSTNGTNVTVEATQTMVLDPNETAVSRHSVSVAGPIDESTNRTWLANDVVAGNVSVLSADDVGSGVVDAYALPSDVDPSASYDVVAVVHNPTDSEQGYAVSFATDGDSPGTMRYVRVGAGETLLVTHSATAPGSGGTVDWRVSGHSATVEVTGDS